MLTSKKAFVTHNAGCLCQTSVRGIVAVAVVVALTKTKSNACDGIDMIV